MKLLIIADVRGWAYDKRAQALKKYAPEDVHVDIAYIHELPEDFTQYDIVYNIDYSMTSAIRQRMRNQCATTKLVNSHNADHQRAREQAETSFEKADYVIFNNRKAWEHYGCRDRTCNISNGVDLDIFNPGEDLLQVPKRERKVVWVGPAGKGLHDMLEPLQAKRTDFTFEFRVKTGKEWDPETHLPNPNLILNDTQMRDWYRSARFVICCSETDATPNYLLEAMACGCVPVTTRVGNALEFKHQEGFVYCMRTVESLSLGLDSALASERVRRSIGHAEIQEWHWRDRSKLFYGVFRQIADGNFPAPFSYSDSRHGVPVE